VVSAVPQVVDFGMPAKNMKLDFKVKKIIVDEDGFITFSCAVASRNVALEADEFLVIKSRISAYKRKNRRPISKVSAIVLFVNPQNSDEIENASLALRPTEISTSGPRCLNWYGAIYFRLKQSTYISLINAISKNSIKTLSIWTTKTRIIRRTKFPLLTVYALRKSQDDDEKYGMDIPIAKFSFNDGGINKNC